MLKPMMLMLATLVLAAYLPATRAIEPAPALVAGKYVIDVRTQEEWDKGHIEGAILIPHDRIGAEIERVLPDRTAPIGLYCGSGRRAGKALETLQAMGYTQVENLGALDDARQKLK